jgi:hypothetical protein
MNDYAALAQRVGLIVDDVRGCLVLSRDGLVLAAFPPEGEEQLKPAWLRFVQMGEVRKAFVEFGDQIWGFVHRGPYAAFVVAGTGVRPGVLLDQLEQVLLAAEASRSTWEPLKLSDAHSAPSGKPRTPLHPPAERLVAFEPVEVATVAASESPAEAATVDPGAAEPSVSLGSDAVVEPSAATTAIPPAEAIAPPDEPPEPEPASEATVTPPVEAAVESGPPPDEGQQDAAEIDRVLLAKEFSGLLQLDSDGDEASG